MNYIGSKYSLLPFIEQTFRQVANGSEHTACDLFAGTGAVGRFFKRLGLRVIANDIQRYAFVLNRAYLEVNKPPQFQRLLRAHKIKSGADPVAQTLALVNHLPGRSGFIAEHYSPLGGRSYYSVENAEKADAIRQALNEWRAQRLVDEGEYIYLLAALLEAIDQVANTASVYGAFLKRFKPSALRPLTLKPLELTNRATGCQVFQRDANELIREIECDVLYLDPPYNHRQYGANYHVLETVAAYDAPVLRGVTGLRPYARSRYCQPRAALAAFAELIAQARARHILVSYNDEGLMGVEEVREVLRTRGEVRSFEMAYNRFKADNGRAYKRDATVEYLHYVKVK